VVLKCSAMLVKAGRYRSIASGVIVESEPRIHIMNVLLLVCFIKGFFLKGRR
jgi:hypothetical protein